MICFLTKYFCGDCLTIEGRQKATLRKIVHRAQSELYGRQQGENFTNKITGVKSLPSPPPDAFCF